MPASLVTGSNRLASRGNVPPGRLLVVHEHGGYLFLVLVSFKDACCEAKAITMSGLGIRYSKEVLEW